MSCCDDEQMDEQTKTVRSSIICNYTINVVMTCLMAALLLGFFLYYEKRLDEVRANYTMNYHKWKYPPQVGVNPDGSIIYQQIQGFSPVKDKDGKEIQNGNGLDWGHFIHPFFHEIPVEKWIWALFAVMCSNVVLVLLTILGAALYNTIILHIGRAHKYLNCVNSLGWLGLIIYVWVKVAEPYVDTLNGPMGKKTTIAVYYHIIFAISVLMAPFSIYQDIQGASVLSKFIGAINDCRSMKVYVEGLHYALNEIKYKDSDDCKYPDV